MNERTDAVGRQLPPWEQPEWATYNNNRTTLELPLTVPQAIRWHGWLTEKIARDKNKLVMLVEMRKALTDEPNEVEDLLAAVIIDDERLVDRLGDLVFGRK
jgi:hypothetical protein